MFFFYLGSRICRFCSSKTSGDLGFGKGAARAALGRWQSAAAGQKPTGDEKKRDVCFRDVRFKFKPGRTPNPGVPKLAKISKVDFNLKSVSYLA